MLGWKRQREAGSPSGVLPHVRVEKAQGGRVTCCVERAKGGRIIVRSTACCVERAEGDRIIVRSTPCCAERAEGDR